MSPAAKFSVSILNVEVEFVVTEGGDIELEVA